MEPRTPRPLPAPDGRRIIPVRLTDIPLDTRLTAARRLVEFEPDANGRQDLLVAALFPSSTVYWVAP